VNTVTAKKLRGRAIYSATRKGHAEFAEDIAQSVLLKFCEGRGKHQTVDQAVLDTLRSEYGVARNGSDVRKRNLFRAEPLEAVPRVRVDSSSGGDFERIIRVLRGTERAMVKLIYEWGFKAKEVGDLFGVTESRISQRLFEVQKRISSAMAIEEQRPAQVVFAQSEIKAWRERERQRGLEILSEEKGNGMEHGETYGLEEAQFWSMEINHEASVPQWFA
jgi:DNA-directed RNA polymerase specialized sigma24 family protein